MSSDRDLRRRFELLAAWAEVQSPALRERAPRVGAVPGPAGRRPGEPARRPAAPLVAATLVVLSVGAVWGLGPRGAARWPATSRREGAVVAHPVGHLEPASTAGSASASGPSTLPGTSDAGSAGSAAADPAPRAPAATSGTAPRPRTPGGLRVVSGAEVEDPDNPLSAVEVDHVGWTASRHRLEIRFTAVGTPDLPHPEEACLRVVGPGGAARTVRPSSVVLTDDDYVHYAGTAAFVVRGPGDLAFDYDCAGPWPAAVVGSLG